LQKLTGIL